MFIFYFWKSLLAHRSQNQWIDGSWVYYDELEYSVIWYFVILCDWIRRLIPLFSGRLGNCPKFRKKFDDALLICQLVITKWCSVWKWQSPYILVKKYTSFPLSILEEVWQTCCTNLILEHSSLYYYLPDGAAAEKTRCCCGEWRNRSHLVSR